MGPLVLKYVWSVFPGPGRFFLRWKNEYMGPASTYHERHCPPLTTPIQHISHTPLGELSSYFIGRSWYIGHNEDKRGACNNEAGIPKERSSRWEACGGKCGIMIGLGGRERGEQSHCLWGSVVLGTGALFRNRKIQRVTLVIVPLQLLRPPVCSALGSTCNC